MTHKFDPQAEQNTTPSFSALDGIVLEPTGSGPLNGKSIVIDPGHGGHDSGAQHDGDMEKTITLAVSLALSDILRARGMKVVMTRADDTFIELQDRAGMSNKYKPDVFLSVHVNDAENASAKGLETFYYADRSIPFATALLDALVDGLGDVRRDVKHGNLAVLRTNTRICSLSEMGFLSNPESHKKLITPEYQQHVAESLAAGIESYLRSGAVKGNASTETGGFVAWIKAVFCRLFGLGC